MKKIFLVFGVFALYSANAQQKDLFDIEKYLQKKATENNGIKFRQQTFDKFKIPDSSPGTYPIINSYIGVFSHKLPNNDRVYILPTDNMPCVVPDLKEFYVMPNAGINSNIILQNRIGQIPNPAKSF
ncbi:MAG: hypothetical protein JNK27_05155 [Chitinophagaceae bacterium]|nr:hypothetical protein [Chitinophagaceae bacterium]